MICLDHIAQAPSRSVDHASIVGLAVPKTTVRFRQRRSHDPVSLSGCLFRHDLETGNVRKIHCSYRLHTVSAPSITEMGSANMHGVIMQRSVLVRVGSHRDHIDGHDKVEEGKEMTQLRLTKLWLFGLALILMFGCSYPISKSLRQEAKKENLTFPMVLHDPAAFRGSMVLWGGEIIETVNLQHGSEIILLETPLDYQEMPESAIHSEGRFIARTQEFLDPAVYKKGKKVTLAGEVAGGEKRPLGKTEYIYPVVEIKEIHLWKEERKYYYPWPYYGWPWGWHGPYGPYYGPYPPYYWY
jgi:outer membrane lipoprotein